SRAGLWWPLSPLPRGVISAIGGRTLFNGVAPSDARQWAVAGPGGLPRASCARPRGQVLWGPCDGHRVGPGGDGASLGAAAGRGLLVALGGGAAGHLADRLAGADGDALHPE